MEKINLERKPPVELHDKLITPERATQLAEETKNKIDFLESIEDRVNKNEPLTAEEEEQKTLLFGNEDFKNLPIGFHIDGLKNKYYQFRTAGVDGAQFVKVSYPTGVYHEITEFENWIKERESAVKELYHYAGTVMDKESENIVAEYNRTAKPEDKIGWWEKEQPHITRWFSAEFFEDNQKKGLNFTFGGSEYRLIKHNDGNWYVALESKGHSFAPRSVEDRLRELDRSIASLLQDKANQTLKN